MLIPPPLESCNMLLDEIMMNDIILFPRPWKSRIVAGPILHFESSIPLQQSHFNTFKSFNTHAQS